MGMKTIAYSPSGPCHQAVSAGTLRRVVQTSGGSGSYGGNPWMGMEGAGIAGRWIHAAETSSAEQVKSRSELLASGIKTPGKPSAKGKNMVGDHGSKGVMATEHFLAVAEVCQLLDCHRFKAQTSHQHDVPHSCAEEEEDACIAVCTDTAVTVDLSDNDPERSEVVVVYSVSDDLLSSKLRDQDLFLVPYPYRQIGL